MNKLFGSVNKHSEQGEHWMSVSDLMAGLMMVFLFISVALMMDATRERDKIKDVAETYEKTQQAIYYALYDEFKNDLPRWGAEINRDDLSLNFTSPEVLFAQGSSSLTSKFQNILDNFSPRYLGVLDQFKSDIQEIRIEGHTSSHWNNDTSADEAYFNNMALSQSRTRAVLHYIVGLDVVQKIYVNWVKSYIAAVGYSSSKLVFDAYGNEDEVKSRRVSFRVITNAEIQIRKILGNE